MATVADWRSNLDRIAYDVVALHPEPFSKVGRMTFFRGLERLQSDLPGLTEEQRVARAMRWLASLGDGHTYLEPIGARFALWYPVRLYEFSDGYYITSAHISVKELAGAQVLEINGRPVGEVAREARLLLSADNSMQAKERLYALHNPHLMMGLGLSDQFGRLEVKLRLRDGNVEDRTLDPLPADDPDYHGNEATFEWQFRSEMFGLPVGSRDAWVGAFHDLPAGEFLKLDTTRPLHMMARTPFISRALPEKSAYYIQANQVDDTNLVPAIEKALAEVDKLKPRHLIVDLRYNFGGDGSQLKPMIQEFIRRQPQKAWERLYLLTGRDTFSAAVMMLNEFLGNLRVTVVGEPAAAALNHYGDPTTRDYAAIGMRLHISTRRWQLSTSDDLSEFIPVDVPAVFSFADYVAGRDPAVDPILKGEEMRSIAIIAETDGGALARAAWKQRKEKFKQYPWWGPPREGDIKGACQRLRRQKRVAEAFEACKLNTELYPYSWNTWFNLAFAVNDMKDRKAVYALYRCVNKLDPNNFNYQAIRDLLVRRGAESGPVYSGCPVQ